MKVIPLAAALGLACTQVSYAQSSNTQPSNTQPTNAQQQKKENVRQEIQSDLKQAGFTNIKVTPKSFFVRAKDKSGNPVMIAVDPNSFEEVALQGGGQQANGGSQKQEGTFTTVPSSDKLSSNVVGLNVYNNKNQDIGTIKDIGMGPNGVQSYILAVGGFLGMGDRYVAVNPSAVKITYNSSDKKWHAEMNANADQLKSAPAVQVFRRV